METGGQLVSVVSARNPVLVGAPELQDLMRSKAGPGSSGVPTLWSSFSDGVHRSGSDNPGTRGVGSRRIVHIQSLPRCPQRRSENSHAEVIHCLVQPLGEDAIPVV